jgi:hypothetical protein
LAHLLLKIFSIQQNECTINVPYKKQANKNIGNDLRSIKSQPHNRANTMKRIYLLTLCLFTLGFTQASIASNQDTKTIKQLETRVEQLRTAMIDADATKLKELTAIELNYGHSGGHVEGQAEFIEKIVSGKSDFVTIELKDQQIQIVKDIAIVRHTLVGTTNNNGKPSDVDIGVMLIWQKQHGTWKLLARQAFKTH